LVYKNRLFAENIKKFTLAKELNAPKGVVFKLSLCPIVRVKKSRKATKVQKMFPSEYGRSIWA
jgi:hypothetical protein